MELIQFLDARWPHTHLLKANVFFLIEGAPAHICRRQMCIFSSEGALAHICQRQMWVPSPSPDYASKCNNAYGIPNDYKKPWLYLFPTYFK